MSGNNEVFSGAEKAQFHLMFWIISAVCGVMGLFTLLVWLIAGR